jgi:hypothetical protein
VTQQSFWNASNGPYLYEDTNVYPDAEAHVPFYGPQVKISESATESMHVVRLQEFNTVVPGSVSVTASGLNSRINSGSVNTSSVDSVVDSSTIMESGVNSQLQSAISSTTSTLSSGDSVAQSAVTSMTSKADSRVDSNVLYQSTLNSVVESRLTVHGI